MLRVQQIPQTFCQWLSRTFDRGFVVILLFYFSSYWFFSFWVLQNQGVIWGSPLSIAHHPFKVALFGTEFWSTLKYMFVQSPLYSYFTWLMLNTDTHAGLIGYIIVHHAAGFFALYALYEIGKYLKIPTWMVVCFLSYFVFNSGFYFAFSMGWNDYLSMCLVTYLAFYFMRLTEQFTSWNLIGFLTVLMILVSYRTLFSPITFFVPIIFALALIFREHWKKIIVFSILPFLITIAPYVKNQMVFGSFSVGIGQFAAALKATTYQWAPKEIILKDIEEEKLSPLVLCFNLKFGKNTIYHGQLYSQDNCKNKIIPEFAAPKVKQLLLERPYLATPSVLLQENNQLVVFDYISNTLTGYVVAEQMIKDSKAFIRNHPREYVNRVMHNINNLFKSNTQYNFTTASNWRHFPEWFNQYFNLAVYHQISFLQKLQTFNTDEYNILIAIGILGSFVYASLYVGNVRNKKFLSVIHLVGLFLLLVINRRYAYMNFSLLWSALFFFWGVTCALKSICLRHVDHLVKYRLQVAFMAMVSLYLFSIILLVPSSEQERYRFAVEGLLVLLFMFWLSELTSHHENI